ncbi:MAG: class I SAM-dependent methyltransferase [Verrucomicrobiales bacterium]|nr:class I SAM-dependent methyltransferase [Verrucomicrobiales bacterium]
MESDYMAVEPAEARKIRTAPRPKCSLCGSDGRFIYSEQKDRLFGASGSWHLKSCPDRKCGLIWLDPMPIPEDIGKAYEHYYTHATQNGNSRAGWLKQTYQLMQREYLAGKYNYPAGSQSAVIKSLGKLLYLFPVHRNEIDSEARFLSAISRGHLLDVGCGSGEWLASMRDLGWLVRGVDFDENAVRVARQRGLEVECGSLEQQAFSNDSFDVVTLNHVIEHVPDPIKTLAECARILKPGGRLILFTPNNASLSHQLFKQDWRGLEPPRHLHLFSMQSLQQSLGLAGFREVFFYPQIAKSVICESILLWRGRTGPFTASDRNWPMRVFARFFNYLEWFLLKWNPSVADCMAAVAIKQ